MNLYLLFKDPNQVNYDEYDSFVIDAPNEKEAREIAENRQSGKYDCKLLGISVDDEPGIVLGSFNAG